MSLSMALTAGRLTEIELQRIESITLTDCRDSHEGFVTLRFADDEGVRVNVYVRTERVAVLLGKLAALFVPEKPDG